MKLYDIPRGSILRIETGRSPEGENFIFHHIDGMYSYCTSEADEKLLHLSASTPLRKVEDHYEIQTKDEEDTSDTDS